MANLSHLPDGHTVPYTRVRKSGTHIRFFGLARLINPSFQSAPDGPSYHAHQADFRPHLTQRKNPDAHTGFAQRHTARSFQAGRMAQLPMPIKPITDAIKRRRATNQE